MEYNVPGFKRSSFKRRGPLMEAGSFDGARCAGLVSERPAGRSRRHATPLCIGIHTHICIYIYIYTEREKNGKKKAERGTDGERRPAITSTSGGAPPRAELSQAARLERARFKQKLRQKTRSVAVDGVLRQRRGPRSVSPHPKGMDNSLKAQPTTPRIGQHQVG